MDHLIGGFDGLLPYAKEIERCGTGGQMFKALAYCNQRYINSLKLVRERLADTGTGDMAAPDAVCDISDAEPDEIWDAPADINEPPESAKPVEPQGKEKKHHGHGIFK